jgi:hypothetical protein
MIKEILKRISSLFLLLIILFFFHDTVHGQMFSVEDRTPQERALFTYSSLSIGWEIADFSYTGDPAEAGLDRFDFNDGILTLIFENPGIDFYLGLGGGLTGMNDQTIVNIGAVLYNDFILHRSDNFWVQLPLQINTDLKRVQSNTASRQFQQSSFQVGAGLGIRNRFTQSIRSVIRAVPAYGFSNSQGAFFGGTVFSFDGKARLIIDEVFGNTGLIFGYDFRLKSYNIDNEIFNYDFSGHTISVGITF